MSECAPTIGQLAQLACTWEVLARKAGNVCPGREFPDLTVNDFLKSAAAIAPILDQAPTQPLGVTILRCIEETRKVVNTNTNLGIVLLLAPLASVPLAEPLQTGLARILAATTIEDSRNVFAAIRLARPGGLGDAPEQDIKGEPTLPLRDVMALAAERDLIAEQYVKNYASLFEWVVPDLVQRVQHRRNVEQAIVENQITLLIMRPDSHIRRRCGDLEVAELRQAALEIPPPETPEGCEAYRKLDAWLRSDNHARNPGTTADLIAAALFVALREGQIVVDAPFAWDGHPFAQHD
ncbi:MAG: triphosphoribosyl-dephospho-CoA synthetase [Gemmataceae bacterium]|nr:triphosphoribosyl-dephospho-CoA synthetase [Gemmataceae bacterium]